MAEHEIDTMPFASRTEERATYERVRKEPGVGPATYRRKTLATIDLMRALTEFVSEEGLSEQFKTWLHERAKRGLGLGG